MRRKNILGLDFDGTVVRHAYPDVGGDIGAIPWLKHLRAHGVKIVLNTMRSGPHLEAAVTWLNDNSIDLYGANNNPAQKHWTSSPKVYAHVYLDDAALGAPLVTPDSGRPYINWDVAGPMLCDAFKVPRMEAA
jgi:hypothetical protein